MISCDTNILFYGINESCPEHERAVSFFESHQTNDRFAICELTLIELYRLLRNPVVVPKPLNAPQAARTIQSFREHPYWRILDYPGGLMNGFWKEAARPAFPANRLFDLRLAVTLKYYGVTQLATRNTKDFQGMGLDVLNPIDHP